MYWLLCYLCEQTANKCNYYARNTMLLTSYYSFLSCCLVFSPVPSFNLLAVWCFFSLERVQVKGRKMITVTHSPLKLGVQQPAHTNTRGWWMKGPTPRVQTWFMPLLCLLVLPTYVWVLTNPQPCLYFRNAPLLSTCVYIMQDGSHLWHFAGNKTYSTVWMSTTRKTQRAFNTLPPVSRGRWRKVQGGVFIPRHTLVQTPRCRQKVSLIVLALFMRAVWHQVKWRANSLFTSVCLNCRTSVFRELQKQSGKKTAAASDGKGSGGMRWER